MPALTPLFPLPRPPQLVQRVAGTCREIPGRAYVGDAEKEEEVDGGIDSKEGTSYIDQTDVEIGSAV